MECGELAKYVRPAFLGDFYRRVAMRYLFMAEEILNEARARGEIANEAIAARCHGSALMMARWWRFQHDTSSELRRWRVCCRASLVSNGSLKRERSMATLH
jgi:hypothetical protein